MINLNGMIIRVYLYESDCRQTGRKYELLNTFQFCRKVFKKSHFAMIEKYYYYYYLYYHYCFKKLLKTFKKIFVENYGSAFLLKSALKSTNTIRIV